MSTEQQTPRDCLVSNPGALPKDLGKDCEWSARQARSLDVAERYTDLAAPRH